MSIFLPYIKERGVPLLGLLGLVLILIRVEHFHAYGGSFPVQFIAIFTLVVFIAVTGGRVFGLIAGALGAAEILHSYFQAIGPPTLTGSLLYATIGAFFCIAIGYWLGLLRDQRDMTLVQLAKHREQLESNLRDKTREKDHSESEMTKHEARLETAFRLARLGHFEFDTITGDCIFCSKRHAAHFGLTPQEFMDDTKGWTPKLSFIHPDDCDVVRATIGRIRTGDAVEFEFRSQHEDGSVRFIREVVEPEFDDKGVVIREIGTSLDLTDLRDAEAKLRESQKLEAVGRLTAGLAHDFNNLLAVIMGNLELLGDATSTKDRDEMIEAALGATRRGAALTSKLLSFGRKSMLNPEKLDLCLTVAELGTLFRRTLPATIEISLPGIKGECVANLDRVQFESAMLNLVVNAKDAMPSGGKLSISGVQQYLDSDRIQEIGLEIEPGEYVEVSVTDTGIGMSQEVRHRALDPFFSTKGVGRGSGLGLSMVLGFAKQSGGDVAIRSHPGKGTTICLYFKAEPADADTPCHAAPAQNTTSGAGALVLLVEDDASVRSITSRQIVSLGYRVLEAETGQGAMQILGERSDVTLVLSDVVMPGLIQGHELIANAKALHPGLKCILMSGYHGASDGGVRTDPSSVARLTKPISRAELAKCLSDAIRK